ncbi:hypothetical protein IED13_04190 [Bosea sp. SSUT16]|uniref:Metallo-beta-lactamase domain-containing protein n=1 Tax=Bosea spartocytisi TaxID=2773451 RepID=A0A927HX04_9HYPH|nr:hypothetical protein [Bosea spartocytisi]MBD3844885.1 hypothetical protein [Bosea spartocytisi]MCT4471087.1 hypothetical protein [Bosea spartocytisi]
MLARRTLLAAGAASLAAPARAHVVTTLGSEAERITILSEGGFEMPLSTLQCDVPAAEIAAQAGPSDPFRAPLNITCLRRGKDLILFDCGPAPISGPAPATCRTG